MRVTLTLDADEFIAAVSEALKAPAETLDGFIDVSQPLSQLGRIDVDERPAAGTNELRILLKPSDRLRRFVTALRTSNVNSFVRE